MHFYYVQALSVCISFISQHFEGDQGWQSGGLMNEDCIKLRLPDPFWHPLVPFQSHFGAIFGPYAEGLPGGSGSARKKGAKIAGTRAGRKCGSQAPIIPSKVTLSSEPWREVSPKEIRVGKRVA